MLRRVPTVRPCLSAVRIGLVPAIFPNAASIPPAPIPSAGVPPPARQPAAPPAASAQQCFHDVQTRKSTAISGQWLYSSPPRVPVDNSAPPAPLYPGVANPTGEDRPPKRIHHTPSTPEKHGPSSLSSEVGPHAQDGSRDNDRPWTSAVPRTFMALDGWVPPQALGCANLPGSDAAVAFGESQPQLSRRAADSFKAALDSNICLPHALTSTDVSRNQQHQPEMFSRTASRPMSTPSRAALGTACAGRASEETLNAWQTLEGLAGSMRRRTEGEVPQRRVPQKPASAVPGGPDRAWLRELRHGLERAAQPRPGQYIAVEDVAGLPRGPGTHLGSSKASGRSTLQLRKEVINPQVRGRGPTPPRPKPAAMPGKSSGGFPLTEPAVGAANLRTRAEPQGSISDTSSGTGQKRRLSVSQDGGLPAAARPFARPSASWRVSQPVHEDASDVVGAMLRSRGKPAARRSAELAKRDQPHASSWPMESTQMYAEIGVPSAGPRIAATPAQLLKGQHQAGGRAVGSRHPRVPTRGLQKAGDKEGINREFIEDESKGLRPVGSLARGPRGNPHEGDADADVINTARSGRSSSTLERKRRLQTDLTDLWDMLGGLKKLAHELHIGDATAEEAM